MKYGEDGWLYTGNLEPAPWFVEEFREPLSPSSEWLVRFRPPHWEYPAALTIVSSNKDTAEFITKARNAHDIMMRRGWTAHCNPHDGKVWIEAYDCGKGGVGEHDFHPGEFAKWLEHRFWKCPFNALCEAEAWYVENVEDKKC